MATTVQCLTNNITFTLIDSEVDKKQAEDKKAEEAAKDDLSKAGASVGGVSVSASGVAMGKAQEAQGQLNDLSKGIGDRVTGTVGGMVAGVTGNCAQHEEYQKQHGISKTLQRGAEADIQKQNP